MTATPGTTEPPSSAAALAALGREVERLRRLVETNQGAVGKAQQAAESALGALGSIRDRLTELAAASVRAAGRGGSNEVDERLMVSWLDLDDGALGAAMLADLVDWLQTIFIHYEGARKSLGECWMYHPAVVEELMALRAGWLVAYRTGGGDPGRAMDWHDRQLPGVLRRVPKVMSNCQLSQHLPGGRADVLRPRLVGTDLAADVAAWWTSSHGTTSAPAPTPAVLAEVRAAATQLPKGGR